MTMPAEAFIDTNVLLRALHRTFPEHERVRALVDQLLHEDCELWISRQVIREYLVQVPHPNTFTLPLAMDQVIRQLAQIEALFRIADDTHDVTAHLLALLQACPTRGKQIHDANIVATMRVNAIDTLLTLSHDDFRCFEDQITILAPDATP